MRQFGKRKIRETYQPIIHRLKKAKWHYKALRTAYWLENAFRTPPSLTIVTIRTYQRKSLFEASLEYLGITDYMVLNEPFDGPWRSTLKVQFLLNFLNSKHYKTKYLLYCDASDSILRDDPEKVLDLFKMEHVDLLFCSTMSPKGYRCMPMQYEWTKMIAPKSSRYLNAGAFVGRTEFIREVFTKVMQYIDLDNFTPAPNVKDCSVFPDFPAGTTDQVILRYLHPCFYPRMDIDYINRIFYRN